MSKKSRRKGSVIAISRREPTENDLEAIRLLRGETIVKGVFDFLKTIVKWGSIVGVCFFIYKTVESIVTGMAGIADALADVLTSLYVRNIVYWITILILVGVNKARQLRNRRLTELVGILRHALEKTEPANSRSGLNPNGEASEDKE